MRVLALLLTMLAVGCKSSEPTPAPSTAPASSAPATNDPAPNAPVVEAPPPVSAPAPKTPPPESEARPCASSSACEPGGRCTTEDGACDRPPGCGPDDICPQVCYGVCRSGAAAKPTTGAACERDEDCQVVSYYCDRCQCLALPAGAVAPKCEGKKVMCVADPCMNRRAVCSRGVCEAQDGAALE